MIINLSFRSLSPKPELTCLLHYSTSAPSTDMNIAEKAAQPRASGRKTGGASEVV